MFHSCLRRANVILFSTFVSCNVLTEGISCKKGDNMAEGKFQDANASNAAQRAKEAIGKLDLMEPEQ